jgi:hypothetical protein
VREVDEFENAINHGVAQGNQGVHESQNDPVHEHLEKYAEGKLQRGAPPY